MKPIIKLDNISYSQDKSNILDDVSFEINSGDFVTIIGPNGAGKSTLLKAILGLIKINSGKISKKKNLKIGYVPQRLVTDFSIPISIENFLELSTNNKNKINDALELVGISNIKNSLLHEISGGEMQKTLLARALLNNPDIIILDEPTQSLDVGSQLNFYKLIEKIHKQKNLAILMVSHDLHMVMASSNRVICFYHHICCSGEPSKVAKDPKFIEIFGKEMSKMMAVYQHQHQHNHDHDCIHDA
jgi:zinc transport system ATP-binding protein